MSLTLGSLSLKLLNYGLEILALVGMECRKVRIDRAYSIRLG
jgi:hypothetical protein